jgi:hypothetical protein
MCPVENKVWSGFFREEGNGGAVAAAEKRPNTVILSSSEGSPPECFQDNARFFVGRRGDLLRMTVNLSFSAAWVAAIYEHRWRSQIAAAQIRDRRVVSDRH